MKNYEKIFKIYYKTYLNRDPGPDGFKHYLSLLKNEKINENEEKAVDTQSYTTSEITRIGKVSSSSTRT